MHLPVLAGSLFVGFVPWWAILTGKGGCCGPLVSWFTVCSDVIHRVGKEQQGRGSWCLLFLPFLEGPKPAASLAYSLTLVHRGALILSE